MASLAPGLFACVEPKLMNVICQCYCAHENQNTSSSIWTAWWQRTIGTVWVRLNRAENVTVCHHLQEFINVTETKWQSHLQVPPITEYVPGIWISLD